MVAQNSGIPLRGITLFIFGGVAELEGEPRSAGREFFMAIAGPVVSLILSILFWILAVIGDHARWPETVVAVLGYLASINATVLVFNMLPAFPLDGGRVLRSILWAITGRIRQATRWASFVGRLFAWLFIFIGVLELFAGNFIGGIWLGLIGMFLNRAAEGSYRQIVLQQLLSGEPVRQLMSPDPIVVPPSINLQNWLEDYVYRFHHKSFPVAANAHLEGVIDTRALMRFPRSEWGEHTVAEAMSQNVWELTVPPNTDALQALEQMRRTGANKLLVVENGQLAGIISITDLLHFFNLKMELESDLQEMPDSSRSRAGTDYQWRDQEKPAHRGW
jgi:Zn-dependent protease